MASPRAKKPTTIERVGAHVKRHGLTYALAGTALGLGLAGTAVAYNYNLMDGVLTGNQPWAPPLNHAGGPPTAVPQNVMGVGAGAAAAAAPPHVEGPLRRSARLAAAAGPRRSTRPSRPPQRVLNLD